MIKIVNDFFDKEQYESIMDHIKNNVYFAPRYFDDKKEKTKENYYGERFVLNTDKNLLDTFIKQSEKKFNIKIKTVHNDCGIDLRNLEEFLPHKDDVLGAKINVLIMLDGPLGFTTGTVFWTKREPESESDIHDLDIHVGFKPNRAILFPSNYLHSSHKCELKGIRRYTSTLFINDYEE